MTSPAMEDATKLAAYWREEGSHLEIARAVNDTFSVEYAAKCRETASALEALTAILGEAEKALEPFDAAFNARRDAYSLRHKDRALGYANFDKMPDAWPMEKIELSMGDFRRARATLSLLREAKP